MKYIFGLTLINKPDYEELQKRSRELEEVRAIIKDTEIQKNKIKLEKEHKSKFGNWYQHPEENMIFQIRGIRYRPGRGWFPGPSEFVFDVWYPNHDDWDDIQINSIDEFEQLSVAQAQLILGFKKVRKANDR